MHVFLVCLLYIIVKNNSAVGDSPSDVARAFVAEKIAPEVIIQPPTNYSQVEYSGKVQPNMGNVLTPNEVKNQPSVAWDANPRMFYTLAFIDPDAVSEREPNGTQFLHWLVGNIPDNNLSSGEVLASYYPPTPPGGSGLHRYTFLVFEQKQRIEFDEPRLLQMSTDNRTDYSIYKFSQKYNLENPVAGNFFLSEFSNENS